jgi:hypothetical protein
LGKKGKHCSLREGRRAGGARSKASFRLMSAEGNKEEAGTEASAAAVADVVHRKEAHIMSRQFII